MPGSAFCSELMARHVEIHSRKEGASIGLTVLAQLEMLIGECWACQGLSAAAAGVSCISFDHLSIVASDIPRFYGGFLSSMDWRADATSRLLKP
jgi:hypothetical protein